MQYHIDHLSPSDWPTVAEIYQKGIQTGIATFRPDIPDWKEWDQGHLPFARLVARTEQNIVIGWAALSYAFGNRPFYYGVTESSIYVDPDYSRLGIGKTLMQALIQESEINGVWTLEARVITKNKASIALHQSCGYRLVGIRERFGKMPDGQWHDVALLERRSQTVGNPEND